MVHYEQRVLRVAHASPGRIRLRLQHAEPQDLPFLRDVAETLGELENVREVRVTARTGSVLVLCDGDPGPAIEHLREYELAKVANTAKSTTPMLRLQQAMEETNQRLAHHTRGIVTVDRLMLVATTLGGLWQTRSGKLLPAGTTLFEYALNAIQREADREREVEHEQELEREDAAHTSKRQ
jgi:hypothetical protein